MFSRTQFVRDRVMEPLRPNLFTVIKVKGKTNTKTRFAVQSKQINLSQEAKAISRVLCSQMTACFSVYWFKINWLVYNTHLVRNGFIVTEAITHCKSLSISIKVIQYVPRFVCYFCSEMSS